ncbi:MAG: ABC transporter permease [Clostridiales bacterium]|nr:ABC transporter permease [Clostridiales bacterium]
MIKYILRRAAQSLATICLVIFAVFMLLRMMPKSGYFTREDYINMDEGMRESYLRSLGVLDPPLVQFKDFIGKLFHGDLGRSITVYPKTPVLDILKEKIPYSAAFGLAAEILSMTVGMAMGLVMSREKGRWPDRLGTAYAVGVRAVPSLVYLFLIQIWVSKQLKLPLLYYGNRPNSWILPLVSMALSSIAWYAIWLRRFMVDEENKEYIQFARVKGFSKKYITKHHIWRNALVPIAIGLPSDFLLIVSGSLVIENLYSIPGTGGLLVEAIKRMDNNLVQALVMLYATLSVLGVFLGDLLVVLVDPRIKLSGKEA